MYSLEMDLKQKTLQHLRTDKKQEQCTLGDNTIWLEWLPCHLFVTLFVKDATKKKITGEVRCKWEMNDKVVFLGINYD